MVPTNPQKYLNAASTSVSIQLFVGINDPSLTQRLHTVCLDSGASFCLIDADYADTYLPDLIWYTSATMTSTCPGGAMPPISKYAIMTMTFPCVGKEDKTVGICLFRGQIAGCKITLGTDFLAMHNAVIDYGRAVIYFPSTRYAARFVYSTRPRHPLLT